MRAVCLLPTLAACLAIAASAEPAAAGENDPKQAIKPADQALARTALVTKADLGAGWVVQASSESTPDPDVDCGGYDPDESHLTVTGDADGKRLAFSTAQARLFVDSGARVYKSLAQANESWRINSKPGVWSCFGKQLEASSSSTLTIRVRSATAATPPAASAPKRLAGRIVFDMTTKSTGQTVRIYMDVLVLQRGRVQALAYVMSAVRPAATGDRSALSGILAAKLRAAEKRDAPPITA
jgi:hypothetical protein